ncbi:HPr kinase/phosphorylase [Cognatiyoonia sp.]|uniref:HPr kinase/phosphorylase n=1 Tax=Cognatiyoonia sp. TaxID=2211652 RepID=UPI003F695A13
MADIYHANSVSIDGKGLLITGASGSGKTSLAFELLALGATLISDDQTCLRLEQGAVVASVPTTIAGQIEARGIGILNAPEAGPTKITTVVDLDSVEQDRIPPRRTITLLGCELPLLYRSDGIPFASVLWHYMHFGRHDDP